MMPLTDSSKTKVSLASLSATTAAAAESLWAKSKGSSRKKQPSQSQTTPLSTPEANQTPEVPVPPSRSSTTALPTSKSSPPILQEAHLPPSHSSKHHLQPLDSYEFRRKFLEGLQFYCENSSLILNSDLPADLIEFVTSHGFSVESLGIILELKKSSSAFTSYVDKKSVPNSSSVLGVNSTTTACCGTSTSDQRAREQNFSEISRRLLQHWMSADSCAEAFVSLSLGEEIPGLIAECASFQRILFTLPDNFNIPGKDFITFLLSQVILSIQALAFGVRKSSQENGNGDDIDSEPVKVRSQVLASFLDRIFMRYFSDSEYFYGYTGDDQEDDRGEGKAKSKSKPSTKWSSNPFKSFVSILADISDKDVIAKRLISKMLLHLSSHSASKFAKVLFLTEKVEKSQNVASQILYPAYEFLEKNPQWKFILQSLSVKTTTKSKRFWLNWAEYIEKESISCENFWKISVDHWIILNKSPLVDEHSLFSASLAITALARQIKQNRIAGRRGVECTEFVRKLDLGRILQNIIHSLESINEKKKTCGMALAQIVADMQSISSPGEGKPEDKLKFDCEALPFLELINFYNNGTRCGERDEDKEDADEELYLNSDFQKKFDGVGGARSHKVEVLDSDDDLEEDNEDDEFPEIGINLQESEREEQDSIDPRILTLRSRKRKIPNYFSEIVETLLESSKNEDEAEILRYIAVLKIPVLLSVGVKVDSKVARTICKCLVDMEDGTSLEIPVLLALYELFVQHPFEISDIIGHVVYDKDSYALGQRLLNLSRLTKIVLLASKQNCFSCYSKALKPHEKELLGICPEFQRKYFDSRRKLRFCSDCKSHSSSGLVGTENGNETKAQSFPEQKTQKELTWREIVDQRVAAKTRYFFSPRSKTLVTVPDEYSSKLLPLVWSAIANRLTAKTSFYLDNAERSRSGNLHDIFLVNVFQYLAKCVLGTSGPNCPHIRSVASHAGELVTNFVQHEDAIVRRTVLSLLAVTVSVGEGKIFVIEALSSQGNMINLLDSLLNSEGDPENLKFIQQIQTYFAGCATTGLLEQQLG